MIYISITTVPKRINNIKKTELVKKSDIIIIATPHKAYKKLKIEKKKVLVDIWGLIEKWK